MRRLTPRFPVRLLAALCLAAGLCVPRPAEAADTDWQDWTLFIVQGDFSKRWRGYFEVQPRLGDDMSRLERLIVRPAIGYRLRDNVSVWAGYGWTPLVSPDFDHEHRAFQQLLVESKVGEAGLTNRTRLEQRVIDGVDGTSLRLRHQVRLAQPLDKQKRWAFILYDELFWNLNSTTNGPESGFDQNRIFAGINYTVNQQLQLETGYLLNSIDAPRTGENRRLHAVVSTVSWRW